MARIGAESIPEAVEMIIEAGPDGMGTLIGTRVLGFHQQDCSLDSGSVGSSCLSLRCADHEAHLGCYRALSGDAASVDVRPLLTADKYGWLCPLALPALRVLAGDLRQRALHVDLATSLASASRSSRAEIWWAAVRSEAQLTLEAWASH